MNLSIIDWLIMLLYFVFVLGIGFALKRFMSTTNDFFLAGRSIPAWVCGLAFISANLGAQEVIGMGASGAKYGIATSHFYWIGAIPAMVFVGVFMMPFYYGSKARSVPEYLRLRFDEKTRAVNAFSFAVMTVFSLRHLDVRHGAARSRRSRLFDGDPARRLDLPRRASSLSALIVLGYIFLGGLTSAIYNEVLQFFLIVAGFLPLVWLGLSRRRRLEGLQARRFPPTCTHSWRGMDHAAHQPAGRGVVRAGDGPRLRALVRLLVHGLPGDPARHGGRLDDRRAAHSADRGRAEDVLPVPGDPARPDRVGAHRATAPARHGATWRVHMPLGRRRRQGPHPGKVDPVTGEPVLDCQRQPVYDYDLAIPNMLLHYFPTGMLGLGLTALLASFMSGMAGNVTAFNTVWTYDIYQSYINKTRSDAHYLWMGRMATVVGIVLSIGAAYAGDAFNNIMDMLQLVFAFVNAPLFATFLLGMFWKRTTGHGAFFGLLSGTAAALLHHGLTLPQGDARRHPRRLDHRRSPLSRAKWRRTSGRRSSPSRPTSSSPSSSASSPSRAPSRSWSGSSIRSHPSRSRPTWSGTRSPRPWLGASSACSSSSTSSSPKKL